MKRVIIAMTVIVCIFTACISTWGNADTKDSSNEVINGTYEPATGRYTLTMPAERTDGIKGTYQVCVDDNGEFHIVFVSEDGEESEVTANITTTDGSNIEARIEVTDIEGGNLTEDEDGRRTITPNSEDGHMTAHMTITYVKE